MADIITTGTSGYSTGSIDTATVLVNNVSPTDAKHPNGCAAAIVQIEGILGSGTTLKGNKADLGARLAVSLTADGTIDSTGAAGITLEDSRTNSSATVLTLTATTSGTPASGIGTRILARAESGDETPSDVGSIDFVFSDVGAGTEDSVFRVLLRRAGAALAHAWQLDCTGAFEGVIRHANTAQRIYTFQDASDTVVGRDTTDTLTNKTLTSPTITSPTITGNTVGTSALKTATGNATGTGTDRYTLHDYAFSPSITNSAGNPAVIASVGSDPGNTIADFTIVTTIGTTTVRWRYLTASDEPTIWVSIDNVTGAIVGAWSSDDPLPNGIPGIRTVGATSRLLTVNELEAWSILSSKASEADAYIRDRKLKPQHQAYRALQLLTNESQAKWIVENCEIKQGKADVRKK